MNYVDSMKRLEEIVASLEAGGNDLDATLKLFEEGMKLTQVCKTRLDLVENRINTIVKNGNEVNPLFTSLLDFNHNSQC